MGMKVIKQALRDNSRCYLATDTTISHFFKICGRNFLAMKDASDDLSFLRFIENWIRENTDPEQGLLTNTLKIFKARDCQIIPQAI